MTGFCWNVRGFNQIKKHSIVTKWLETEDMKFGCIVETRVKENQAHKIISTVFREWNFCSNYDHNRLGRIWVLWSKETRLTPVYNSGQIITVSVRLEGAQEDFFCSFVYAASLATDRKELWQDLRNHYNAPMFQKKPWIIMGDFNEILKVEEHSHFGDLSIIPAGMRDFQEVVCEGFLEDLTSNGVHYSWCNKREVGLICKKLDRVLVNEEWHTCFPHSYCIFDSGGCSDHARCKIKFGETPTFKKKSFKFSNVLVECPNFLTEVDNYWQTTERLFISTSTIFRFTKKLKGLKPILRRLGKENLSDISKKAKECLDTLCLKQNNLLIHPTVEAITEEKEAYEAWMSISSAEEKYLKQKAKLHWLKVGDSNNSYFHKVIKERQSRNAIKEIKRMDGTMIIDQQGVKDAASNFFEEFLNHKPQDYSGISVDDLKEILNYTCSPTEASLLTAEISEEEIQKTLFKMPTNKAPGPDGYTVEFYKAAWSIVGKDFFLSVKAFFANGFLPKGANSTILALIPKKAHALEMKDYRPISCCNIFYKVISKILANRLKILLPQFISPSQSAFVKHRLLMENVLLASELVKDYHKDNITQRSALKIDISKAFDSVQWDFLLNSLLAIDIPRRFVDWISICISTASFSVQVNGDLAGYFSSCRGLRQGCSLSPYLFVISMNVLSKLLEHVAGRDGRQKSIEEIVKVFDGFAVISGLKISIEKSTLFLAGMSAADREAIFSEFPFEHGKLPVRYLGLPLMTKRMTKADYISSSFRKDKGLHKLVEVFRLPSECVDKIEKLCSAFLWSGPSLNSKKAKVSWDTVCSLKSEGGLGLKRLKDANKALCLKLIWRVLSVKNSLWVDWIHMYLIQQSSFWDIEEKKNQGSWIWRKLLKYRNCARDFHKVQIGSGTSVHFWFDKWSSMGCLWNITGSRGVIDMGISRNVKISEIPMRRRRRNHRVQLLKEIEYELSEAIARRLEDSEDKHLWRNRTGAFKSKFVTKDTWLQIKRVRGAVQWHDGIWFTHATPKFSFLTWLAVRNRLYTGEVMQPWRININLGCSYCDEVLESRDHLFFGCRGTAAVWVKLVGGLLQQQYTEDWATLMQLISTSLGSYIKNFLFKYTFQATIHTLWRERNRRRHGEKSLPTAILISMIDSIVKNRIHTTRHQDTKMENALIQWYEARRD